MKNVIWLGFFVVPIIVGIISAFFLTQTAQIIVGVPLVIYFLWAKKGTIEDSEHVIWSIFGLLFILGLGIGDVFYLCKDFFHISFQIPKLLR